MYRRGGLKIHTTIDPSCRTLARAAINSRAAVTRPTPARRSSRSTRTRATSRRWPRAAPTRTASSTSPPRAIASPARRSRRSCSSRPCAQGVDPNSTTYVSEPLDLNVPGYGPWKVSTYDDSYGGTMDLVQATLAFGQHGVRAARHRPRPEERARDRRDDGHHDAARRLPAEGLGGLRLGVSPLEMANAYATLASYGIHNEPMAITKVEFPDGKTDELGKPKRKRVFPEWVAYEATKILEQNVLGGHGHGGADRLRRRRQDRARPTTSTTRGSSATRPTSRRRSGSATRTPSSR